MALKQKRTTVGKIRNSWQIDSKDQESQHPLSGRGALVCNPIQLAWEVDRNKGNVLSITKQNENPRGCIQRRGKDPSFINKETTILSEKTNVLPWSESGGTLGK